MITRFENLPKIISPLWIFSYSQGPIKQRVGLMWIRAPILIRTKNLNIFDELIYIIWPYKLVMVGVYHSQVLNILENHFYKEKLILLLFHSNKLWISVKGPIGCALVGPRINHVLCLRVKNNLKNLKVSLGSLLLEFWSFIA